MRHNWYELSLLAILIVFFAVIGYCTESTSADPPDKVQMCDADNPEAGAPCHEHVCKCGGNFHATLPEGQTNPENKKHPNYVCKFGCAKIRCCRCPDKNGKVPEEQTPPPTEEEPPR